MKGNLFDSDSPAREVQELEDDAAFWGIPIDLMGLPEDQGVWPEHVAAVEAFLICSSQWRTVARFGAPPLWIGLDYTGCSAAWDMAGVEITPQQWAEIQLIEAGAKAALNEA